MKTFLCFEKPNNYEKMVISIVRFVVDSMYKYLTRLINYRLLKFVISHPIDPCARKVEVFRAERVDNLSAHLVVTLISGLMASPSPITNPPCLY